MASKLEALVNSRIHSGSGKELLLDALVTDQEQEPHQLMSQTHNCSREEFGSAFKEFYSILKAATLGDDDHAKSFQLLEHARSIANKLIAGEVPLFLLFFPIFFKQDWYFKLSLCFIFNYSLASFIL